MKFQKDNSNIALTSEMKESAIRERQEFIERAEKQREETAIVQKEIWKLQDQYQEVLDNVSRRQLSYMPVDYQLDLLWHDMDSGAITVDKTSSNTWYHHIKEIKEKYPVTSTWRDDIVEIQKDLHTLMANSNIEVI